jgi:transcription termination factor Rho
MTAEQQLERSVLEGKERDELHAIAQAMSLKATTRTKKSDLIDRILEATGVAASGEGASPASGRKSGSRASAASAGTAANGTSAAARNGAASRASTDGAAATDVADAGVDHAGTATHSTTHDQNSNGPASVDADGGDAQPAAAETAATATAARNGRSGASSNGAAHGTLATADAAATPDADADADADSATASNGSKAHMQTQTQTQTQTHTQGSQNGGRQGQAQQSRHQAERNAEPGNRRGRRRRGRDRGTSGGGGGGGGERGDLQGAGGGDAAYQGELVEVRGLLDLRDEGYGFLRCDGYLPSSKDVYVSISQARRFALRKGDYIEGACRPASSNEKYPALLRIDKVSALDPEAARQRPRFEDLTPLFPDSKLMLEMPGAKENVTARIVDLLSPIGKGQRGLIVSPPKAGKTTVMKQIAHSIEANNPEVHLMVLLVDERPEEVTDMRRSVNGEVVASTFDRPSDEHTAVAELAIERAKRLVEQGRDVVIILDGITRLARAYNLAQPATGRIMSGGVDSGALYPPKKFFGAARNIEEGGSLTILATALVETGSKMDEVIFEEFKGTGNMELRLDRRLAERRLYPSIDVNASSTRHEELLFDRGQLQQVWKLRRVLNALANEGNAAAGLELLMDKLRTTKSNDEFLAEIAKGPTPGN